MVETSRWGTLTPRQRVLLAQQWHGLQRQTAWHGQLPVLLLNRCWLRLEVAPVADLARLLPPDSTAEAPELARFRGLRHDGIDPALAETLCWREFGPQACQAALRRYWEARDRGNHGWTLASYLAFLARYRAVFERPGRRPLPLVVLARSSQPDPHQLHWLPDPGAVDAANLPPD
ncbi:hypothetical protein KBY66_13315 [Synechococcus sp. Tobar12-5m-g]|uniref:hypothetical protein n=1 Tax=unclassified Synechococcus TaxID=2626047 RepID=UPI0020CEE4F5|nr:MULTISPECIES: hypothetical protein [unclassified Synechococcus]MCP9773580.1 hypothetical protein [Synechococcus sp. Tobar12-5m-g]MCP9874552.1 hypothetical protein [Synechococcus sp. Cruz CV-v-12]